jgi:P27 family predicted phage terminase small subunit
MAKIKIKYTHLNDEVAKTMYKNIKEKLEDRLSELDEPLLIAMCNQYGRYIKLEKEVKKQGEVVYTSNGNPYLNPTFNAMQSSLKAMQTLSKEFALSLVVRVKNDIKLEKEELTEMDKILFGLD